MTDSELIQLFLPIIEAGLTLDGFTDVEVVQNDQPTQQGINNIPTVYFSKVSSKLYGFRQSSDNSLTTNQTGTFTNNSITVTGLSSTSSLFVGQEVSGVFITPGTIIESIE